MKKNGFLLLALLLMTLYELRAQQEDLTKIPLKSFDWSISNHSSLKVSIQQQGDFAFTPKKGTQTNAVLIIKDDHIIFEKYRESYEGLNPLWSISKSISGAIIGIRLKQLGLTPLSPIKAQLNFPLTYRDLLQMSSGLYWNETYESNPFDSHVVNMLYGDKYKNMGAYPSEGKFKFRPGHHFNYSSGETNFLMKLFKESFDNSEEALNYPWQKLFDPIGIDKAVWEIDHAKTFVGSSYLFLSARDLARFARLYLKRGQWEIINHENKIQLASIIPESFISESFLVAPSICQTDLGKSENSLSYGYHWWLNKPCPEKEKLKYKNLPTDMVLGLGHYGQVLAIFPSLNSIAIRFGTDKGSPFDKEKWLEITYNTLKSYPSLELQPEGQL